MISTRSSPDWTPPIASARIPKSTHCMLCVGPSYIIILEIIRTHIETWMEYCNTIRMLFMLLIDWLLSAAIRDHLIIRLGPISFDHEFVNCPNSTLPSPFRSTKLHCDFNYGNENLPARENSPLAIVILCFDGSFLLILLVLFFVIVPHLSVGNFYRNLIIIVGPKKKKNLLFHCLLARANFSSLKHSRLTL